MLKLLLQQICRKRTEAVVDRVILFLNNSPKILDIGSGTGDVAAKLRSIGKDVTPMDVTSFHWYRTLQPIIYDGINLPFSNLTFDIALLLMVMHHTPNPYKLFSEAARVADEIVVIETSYVNAIHKLFTVIFDVLGNLQIQGYWNSYKKDKEWKTFFDNHGFKIEETHKYWDKNMGLPFLHISYHLKRKSFPHNI